jgi:N utilization substance protein B
VPKRRLARTIALQILYSLAYNEQPVDEASRRFSLLERERKRGLPPFATDLVRMVTEHEAEFDERINAQLEHWRPERLLLVDRLILRLACAEFFHFDDIPPKVTLDEYIEIARRFGDDASPAFVNGVLDAVLKFYSLPESKKRE